MAHPIFASWLLFVLSVLVVGCSTKQLNTSGIRNSASTPVTASMMNGSFWMTGGASMACSGAYKTTDRASIEVSIKCRDGRSGSVTLSRRADQMTGSGNYWLSDGSTGLLSFSEIGASSSAKTKQALQAPKSDFVYSAPEKTEASSSAASAHDVIAASRVNYPGNCPCPYDRDSAGRKCGKRSAYSRAGGYSVKCYPSDVTAEDIAAFGKQ
jgi:hypothetical protein